MQLKVPFPNYSNPKIAHHSNLASTANLELQLDLVFGTLVLTVLDQTAIC